MQGNLGMSFYKRCIIFLFFFFCVEAVRNIDRFCKFICKAYEIIATYSEEVNPLKTNFVAPSRVPAFYEGHTAPEMLCALSCTFVFLSVLFLSVAFGKPCLLAVILLR